MKELRKTEKRKEEKQNKNAKWAEVSHSAQLWKQPAAHPATIPKG
jgi:hypothetical protein